MNRSPHSDTETEGIRIRAAAHFVSHESRPDERHWVYAYRIVIENRGRTAAKLLTRHWVIVDADGNRRDVKGPGVVGKQPDLAPGERFQYVSGCPLPTPWGTMEGTYTMERANGDRFQARIERFFLVPTAAPVQQSDV